MGKAASGSTFRTLSEEAAADVDIVVPAPKAAPQPQPKSTPSPHLREKPEEYRLG